MSEERQISRSEARLGLSIIFVLLAALGAGITYRVHEASRAEQLKRASREPASILRITKDSNNAAPTPLKSEVQQASYPEP